MAKTRRPVWNSMIQDEQGETSKQERNQAADNPFAEIEHRREDNRREASGDRDQHFDRTSLEDVLYVHPNDHAGLQLVAVQLTGNNFYTWSRSIKRALGARNKLDLINGNLLEPDVNSRYHKAWLKADYLVSTWIMNAMSKEIANAFQYIDDSRTLWDEIQSRFDRSNGPKLYQLERDLGRCVQNNMTVMEYFNNMSTLWDEINILNPNPTCTCVVCTCGAGQALKQINEKRRVNQFLLGLNDSFETVRSQILLLDPLPSVSRVYSLVLQDEDQKKATMLISNTGESAFLAKPPVYGQNQRIQRGIGSNLRSRMTREEKRKLKCTHCGYTGHEVNECFKLHGIPDWFKALKEQKLKEQVHLVTDNNDCVGESSMEHIIKDEVQRCITRLNQNSKEHNQEERANLIKACADPFEAFGGHFAFGVGCDISSAQWILDSGASVHICCNQSLMTSIKRLEEEQKVYLPDGAMQVIKYVGDVHLSPNLILRNVLFAPTFTHNLISVGELARQVDAKCTFLDSHCLIQKKSGDSIIGIAKACGKLYVINTDLLAEDSGDNSVIATRRGRRDIRPPAWTKDFVACMDELSVTSKSVTETLTPCTFPYIISSAFSSHYVSFMVNISELKEPASYSEACAQTEWIQAMNLELEALEHNGTWILTDLPAGKNAIGSKWVYKIKLKSDGTVERCKARLVAKGYNQEYGIDYLEVFSPVAKLVTVRTILALAASREWDIHQIDINNAFLHGNLQEDIYMKRPQGYTKGDPTQVCKLVKSLYGLKQASREWNSEFCKALSEFGFAQSAHDQCLFTKGSAATFLGLLVYVDDVLLVGPNLPLILEVKDYLHQKFTIKDLGPARFFLGMEIARSDTGLYVCQRKYILEILERMGMLGCVSAPTPLPLGLKLTSRDRPLFDQPDKYRRLIGQLLYLNLTRPDIAFGIQQLSQFITSPAQSHWEAALHILRYLKGSPSLGLLFPTGISDSIIGFSDADWGTCPDTRRSLTGFCIFFGSSLVSWRCKKQNTVSLSTAESEYRALSACARELQWLVSLLTDFTGSISLPITIYCDNSAAIQITKNPVFHERTKHIELDCHHVRDLFRSGFLIPVHLSTQVQIADIFTKCLPGPRFSSLLFKMGLVDVHRVHLEGGC